MFLQFLKAQKLVEKNSKSEATDAKLKAHEATKSQNSKKCERKKDAKAKEMKPRNAKRKKAKMNGNSRRCHNCYLFFLKKI